VRRLVSLLVLALVLAGAAVAAPSGLPGSRAAWRAFLHWPNACEEAWRTGSHGEGVFLSKTATPARLVEVTCFQGPYQYSTMLYLLGSDRHVTGPLPLATYIDPGTGKPKAVRETIMLGVLNFHPSTGRLELLDLGRGVGDCGIYTVATLRGARLVTSEVRAKLACDGKPPYDGARWPKLPLPRAG